jgi:hypothetical protein
MHVQLVVPVIMCDVFTDGLEVGLQVLAVVEHVAPLHLDPAIPEGFHSLSSATQGLKLDPKKGIIIKLEYVKIGEVRLSEMVR